MNHGKILADLHVHIPRRASEERVRKALSSGVTGLAARNGDRFLTYEDALGLPGAREIDKGLLAEFQSDGQKGYAVNVQEVLSPYHILAIGCREMIEDCPDARRVVEEIHMQRKPALLAHPYILISTLFRSLLRNIVIAEGSREEQRVKELCGMVDEVEAFNAHAIDIFPYRMKAANDRAKKLASAYGFRGIAATDAYLPENAGTSGIWIPEDNLTFEALCHYIKSGQFERRERYVSRRDFVRGRGSYFASSLLRRR